MITNSGKIVMNPPIWDEAAAEQLIAAANEAARMRAGQQQCAKYRARVRAAGARRDSIVRNGGTAPQATEAAPTAANLYYELGSTGLGWINCDRFVTTRPLLAFAVDVPEADAKVMLVLQGTRSIINGVPTGANARVEFGQLPAGEQATVVAMRWQRKQALLATWSTTVSEQPLPRPLNYRFVTMLEL